MAHSEGQLSKFIAIFAGGTMISRVLGLVRDSMVNAMIPVGPREAFLVAFRLPNTLRDIVGEGASNAAIIPVLSEVHEKKSKEEFQAVVSSVFGGMIVVLALVTALGVLLVPWMLSQLNHLDAITSGKTYSPEELSHLVSLGRWTFPYIFFIGLAVFSMGVLFTVRRYSTSSWAPALLNVAMIGSCLLSYTGTMTPGYALVLGVWIGGIAQVAVQQYSMGKHTGVWMPSFRLNRSEIYTILGLMVPVAIGQAAGEVNKMVDTLFAYKSAEGSVTALYSANRLVQLPLSVFGFATAAAVLPAVSRAAAQQRPDQIRALLMHGFRQTYFLITPSMIGLIVLGEPIVRLLFQYGRFTAINTEWTTNALIIYAMGLLAFAWVKVAVSGFYAVKDTRTPVLISSGSMILNIALCFLFVKPYGYKGLAAATTFSYFVNFGVLYILLCQRYKALWDAKFISGLIRMSLATAAMGALAYGAYVRLRFVVPETAFAGYGDTISGVVGNSTAMFLEVLAARAVVVLVPMLIAVLSYLLLSKFFGVDEFESFLRLLRRKKEAKAKAK
ncbi:MAG: murein biosynthesis integral membrane protein MurJ [Candidatus Hydrogenedentes bacterium]|nr:murein biosynthesis integral membrane protein MurJ [Candidatus Hydrogenedentota bacterium]